MDGVWNVNFGSLLCGGGVRMNDKGGGVRTTRIQFHDTTSDYVNGHTHLMDQKRAPTVTDLKRLMTQLHTFDQGPDHPPE